MSKIKIHIKINHETGLRDITIEYDSVEDILPIEHEQRHMEIVHELIDSGVIESNDVGEIKIVRPLEQIQERETEGYKTFESENETGLHN